MSQPFSTHTSTFFLSRWIFLRMFGVVTLFAFISLWFQFLGLVGENGILPASPYLHAIFRYYGPQSYSLLPTVFWFGASDQALQAVIILGMGFSICLILDIAPALSLLILWIAYLSLVNVGRTFLAYQWDNLLLEVGFLAMLLAPLNLKPGFLTKTTPSPLALWLCRLVLFRLYFFSGLVKLQSNDPAWRDMSALRYHFETQPLPTWTSWYMHQLPPDLLALLTRGMFVIELFIPILIFMPQKLRRWAFFPMASLQVGIFLTGNYGFFNILSFTLCVLLLDDDTLRSLLPHSLTKTISLPSAQKAPLAHSTLLLLCATLILFVSATQTLARFIPAKKLPAFAIQLRNKTRPFRTINRYGLFAVMTKTRPEIFIQGSQDGRRWRTYPFRWKPGPLKAPPAFATPHLPRLDWQMWGGSKSTVLG